MLFLQEAHLLALIQHQNGLFLNLVYLYLPILSAGLPPCALAGINGYI